MECKFNCCQNTSSVSFDILDSRECEWTIGSGLLERNVCKRGRERIQRCHLLTSFQEDLEGDCGRDRVRRCRLLTSFQEGPHQKLFFQGKIFSKFCKQDCKLDYSRYCQVSLITNNLMLYHWQTHRNSFLFLFSFTEIWR